MTLSFPTLAEKAHAEWTLYKRTPGTRGTLPLQHFIDQFGGVRDPESSRARRVFSFDDDTTLVATGAGAGLKIKTFLP